VFSLSISVPKKPHLTIFTAVTLDTGVQWHEAYDAVSQYGRMIAGGASLGPLVQQLVAGFKAVGTVLCRLLMVLVWL